MKSRQCPFSMFQRSHHAPVTRRHFLKELGAIAACAGAWGAFGGAAPLFASQPAAMDVPRLRPSTVGIVKSMKHELVGASWHNPFAMVPEGEPPNKIWQPSWSKQSAIEIEEMVRHAVSAAGDWPIEKGDVVAIKTNLVASGVMLMQIGRSADADMQSTVTDARVVRALCMLAKEAGAKKIYIVANPMAADGYLSLRQYGYGQIADETGAELVGLSESPYRFYKAPFGLAYKQYALPTLMVDEADKVISAASLKTHMNAGVTLTLKNVGIGTPSGKVYGGPRIGLPHDKLAEVITDVCSIVKIDYAVIDAIWGMEGAGPINGNAVSMDTIIAGPDPVAVDGVGTELMGFQKEAMGTSRMAMAHGLGTFEKTTVTTVGAAYADVVRQFESVPRKLRSPGGYADVHGWDG